MRQAEKNAGAPANGWSLHTPAGVCESPRPGPDRSGWRALLEYGRSRPGDGAAQGSTSSCPGETESILFSLAVAVEQRDQQTAGHCERLALISVSLGIALGLARTELIALYRGGYLHDIGKVGIPDSILFKPDRLSAEEWVTMRSHPIRGEDICKHMQSLSAVLPIIRHHHERWDGHGYPDGLRGDQIPLLARVVQIADIYDALVSPRPYKRAFEPTEALRLIEQETSNGWRDPSLVNLFFKLHEDVILPLSDHAGPDYSLAIKTSLANLERFIAS